MPSEVRNVRENSTDDTIPTAVIKQSVEGPCVYRFTGSILTTINVLPVPEHPNIGPTVWV